MNDLDLERLASAFDLSEADIADQAEKLAKRMRGALELWQATGQSDAQIELAIQRTLRRHYVALPHLATTAHALNRMTSPAWWRKALRKRLRMVEAHQIASGAVHKQASPYVSAKAMRRRQRDERRFAELIAALEAVNVNTGEALPLEEVIATSQANPAMRRMAMMARIKGIEGHAKGQEHAALFITITAPSRMHARHQSGQANDKHNGTGPRDAQAYLNRVWRKGLRAAAHQGLEPYGLRTVEPHHDACPHWHVLLFIAAEGQEQLVSTLQKYALQDSPNEPGASEHRFKVERIDPAKGSAAAYVAKYVAKGIDGFGVDDDNESGAPGHDAAARIVAWARIWGIRQFQFFGLPAITPTRELYRLGSDALPNQGLEAAHQASKAKDYAAYLGAIQAHGIGFRVQYEERASNRYAGEVSRVIRGLFARTSDMAKPLTITTRTETWRIQPRQGAAGSGAAEPAFPWTRFNNCAPPDKSTTYAKPVLAPPRGYQRPAVDPRLRARAAKQLQLEPTL